MSSFLKSSWPGWAIALLVHTVVVGGLLLKRPTPRPGLLKRPPVQVRLASRQAVPPAPLAVESAPRAAAPLKNPRSRRAQPRLTKQARVTRPEPAVPRPVARPDQPAPPRFSVSMSATIQSGGVEVPVSASAPPRLRSVPAWASGPAPAVISRGTAGAQGNGELAANLETDAAATPPRLLTPPDSTTLRAAYPSTARARGVEADVLLKILVDTSGRVSAVRLLRGAGDGFDEAASRLVQSFRFAAGRDRTGRRVSVWIPWTYKFRLNG